MKILQFPLAKISICFIFGVLFFHYYQLPPKLAFVSLILSVFLLILFHFLGKKSKSFTSLFGIITLLLSFLTGISTAIIHKETYNRNHYTNQIRDYEKSFLIDLVINEKLKNTQKNIRYISFVKNINHEKSFGRIILNIKKTSQSDYIKIGTRIEVEGTIYKNRNPFNPNQFDYGKYLENQEIYAQIYTDKSQIKIGTTETTVWSQFSNFRTKIIKNLKLSNIKKEELNILIALILGQQQDISPEILKDYQYAGAVHILSVSGLHVGFILIFITFLLKPIPNSKKGSLLKLFIILLSLWTFGILAGLAPSVLRSVTMFSFLAIGNHIRRTINIYHTLLVSMVVILLFKPSFLFDIGFQLSYLALFFILWLQPILASIWQPKNKILSYFWDIITVSFAAQIGAMPLSIYYFHQFPGLFFITNLIVLPLLGLIMVVGLIAIIIACFNVVPVFIVKPLEMLIEFLNYIIHWVATIDTFVIKNISFSKEMLWSSYLVIILLVLWIKKAEFKRLVLAFLSIIIVQSIFIFQKNETLNKAELIVFNCKKNTIITQRIGDVITVYSNDSILENLNNNLLIQSYLIGNFCKTTVKKSLRNMMYFKNTKVLIIDSSCIYTKGINPDVLVIIQSPKLNIQRLLKTYQPKEIVVDGSNYKSYVRLWEATCRKEKIPFHNTNEKGFYKI
jgi:competence protein ComEC